MGKRIKVLIIEPGKEPRQEHVHETPEEIQKIIGGYIEEAALASGLVVLSDSDSWHLKKEPNCLICGMGFSGTVILCGKRGGKYSDLPDAAYDLLANSIKLYKDGEAF